MPSENCKLLLIEDDPFLIEWVERLVGEHFPETKILSIRSEREFLLRKDELTREEFRGIILDVMLPWEEGVETSSDLYLEPRGTYFDAGIRIMNDVEKTSKLANVPILIQTVSDRSAVELPRGSKLQITFLRKDEPDYRLIHWISRLR